MNETRNIKVVKTDGSVIQVRLNSFDVARSLALVSSLTEPVILIHHGRCLYPFMSIASQNVSDGDVVILKPVKTTSNSKSKLNEVGGNLDPLNRCSRLAKPQRKRIIQKSAESPNQIINNYRVFEEVLRISDLQFKAYESSLSGSFAYQQMAEILNYTPPDDIKIDLNVHSTIINETNSKSEKTNTKSDPNDVPLPVFWPTTEEEFNGQNQTQMNKIPDLPGPPKIVPSPKID